VGDHDLVVVIDGEASENSWAWAGFQGPISVFDGIAASISKTKKQSHLARRNENCFK